jgi:hypothetical protein
MAFAPRARPVILSGCSCREDTAYWGPSLCRRRRVWRVISAAARSRWGGDRDVGAGGRPSLHGRFDPAGRLQHHVLGAGASTPCVQETFQPMQRHAETGGVAALHGCWRMMQVIVSWLSLLAGTSSVPHACESRPMARSRQKNVALLSFPLGSAKLHFAAVSET